MNAFKNHRNPNARSCNAKTVITKSISRDFLSPLAVACAFALTGATMAKAQSPVYPTQLFPSSYSGLVWTAPGGGNWNTDTNWDYAIGDGTYYVRDDSGPVTDLDPISIFDAAVYFQNTTANPFNINLTSNVQTGNVSVAQGTVIVNLNGFTLNVDDASFFSPPYVAPPSPGTLIFNGSGVVNFNLGTALTIGGGGSANNVFAVTNGASLVPFAYSTTGNVVVNASIESNADVTVGSAGGGINNVLEVNAGSFLDGKTVGHVIINAGSTTGASNNRIIVDGAIWNTAFDIVVNGSGTDGVNANNQLIIQNGGVVHQGAVNSSNAITIGDGSSLIIQSHGALTGTSASIGSAAGSGANVLVQGQSTLTLINGLFEGSNISTVVRGQSSLIATGLGVGTASTFQIDDSTAVTGGVTLNSGAILSVRNGSSVSGAALTVDVSQATTPIKPMIYVDSSSTMSFTGGLNFDQNLGGLVIKGGGSMSFGGIYTMAIGTDPSAIQLDTGTGSVSVNSLGLTFTAPEGSAYQMGFKGTLIVGAGGFKAPTGDNGSNAGNGNLGGGPKSGGLHISSGENLQLANGSYTGKDSVLIVDSGGMLSGNGTIGTSLGVLVNGGTVRPGSASATTAGVLDFEGSAGNTGSGVNLSTSAPSTFAFTVFGFGGFQGNLVTNYDQIRSSLGLNSMGFTNTISLNLKVDQNTLMGFEPGASGDQFQFFTKSGQEPGSAAAAVNLGSVNFSYGTSAAELASAGLAWDPDATSFATTGLMGLKEVAWMQLNNSAPVDAATALTINNGIRSAADGFSGNGVNGTLLSQTVKGAGWSVTGSAADGTAITAGGNLAAGTTAFAPGSNTTLNGNYAGVVTANFDLGNGVQGSQTWNLSHKISGIVADSGQAGLIAGQSYAGFGLTSTRGTTATILGGTASGDTTLTMGFAPNSNPALKSDILTLTGVAHTGSFGFHNSTLTDEYVLEISYNGSAGVPFEVAWFDMMANGGSGEWVNAISGNSDSTGDILDASNAIVGAYAGETTLGQYGYDPATQTAWAVVDHSSDFAVMPMNVPEPGANTLVLVGAGLFAGCYRMRRGNVKAAHLAL